MIERGLGYWLEPEGGVIPVPPRISHADVARELIDETDLNEKEIEDRLIDINAFAQSQGWTRIRIYPSQDMAYVDFGTGRRTPHARAVTQLLEHLGLDRVAVKYTDEQGNYVSP